MSLLYFGKEASFQEKTTFMQQLQMQASLSPTTVKAIEKLPREGHPMKLLSAAVLIVGMLEGKGDYRKDCISLMAKMPHLVAAVINYHAGWGATPPPQKERGYMENFAHQLLVPGGDTERLAAVFRLFNILHYDHGGGNLSAFVGKAVASGLEDLYGYISQLSPDQGMARRIKIACNLCKRYCRK